ncbi:MAG: helix-turn-helix domain-containing protein [Dechloromonas sp.]|nr:helix-turn-helix domain-containing protein [Dechloromonas sp.]
MGEMRQHPSPSTAKSKLPGMKYSHLNQDERYQIASLAKAGHDRSDKARVMNRHNSSVGREMTRNRGVPRNSSPGAVFCVTAWKANRPAPFSRASRASTGATSKTS